LDRDDVIRLTSGSLVPMVHSTRDSAPGNMIYDRAELVERGLRGFYGRDGLREVDIITFANAYRQVHGKEGVSLSAQPSS
jgi:hypothetical protein